MWKKQRKVFCIGFNKTGTSSLHRFFQESGLKSLHGGRWAINSRLRKGKHHFLKHQCYSDDEQADFRALDAWFPGSLFILNDRSDKAWLYSRIKHVLRYPEALQPEKMLLDRKQYGPMALDLAFGGELAIRKWLAEKRIYTRQAEVYFANRSDFLRINVPESEDWSEQLIAFFERNDFPIQRDNIPEKIHENVRKKPQSIHNEVYEKYRELADAVLADTG